MTRSLAPSELRQLQMTTPSDRAIMWLGASPAQWVKWQVNTWQVGEWSACHIAKGSHTLCGIELLNKLEDEVVRYPHTGRACRKCLGMAEAQASRIAETLRAAIAERQGLQDVSKATPEGAVSAGAATGSAGA